MPTKAERGAKASTPAKARPESAFLRRVEDAKAALRAQVLCSPVSDLEFPGRVASALGRRGIEYVGDALSLPEGALVRHGLRGPQLKLLGALAEALGVPPGSRVPGWEQVRPLARHIGPLASPSAKPREQPVQATAPAYQLPAPTARRSPRSHHFRLSAYIEARIQELAAAHNCSLTLVVCAAIVAVWEVSRQGGTFLVAPTYSFPPAVRPSKRSHHFRLPADVEERLKELASTHRCSQTEILASAVIAESDRYRRSVGIDVPEPPQPVPKAEVARSPERPRRSKRPGRRPEVEPGDLISLPAACSILGISRAALLRLVDEGRLAGERVGKRWRFSRARVLELAEEPSAPVYSLDEARALMGISRATLYRLLQGGKIPGATLVSRRWQFDRAALQRFLSGYLGAEASAAR